MIHCIPHLHDKLLLFQVDDEGVLHLHGVQLLDEGRVDANDVGERWAYKVYQTVRQDRNEHMLSGKETIKTDYYVYNTCTLILLTI